MADIITLKDLKNGGAVYPRTHVSAVLDDNNTPLDIILENHKQEVQESLAETEEKLSELGPAK